MLRCTSSSVERPVEAGRRSISRRICARPRSIAARSCRGRMPARGEHARVRERAVDVVLREALVEVDRRGEALDQLVDAARRSGPTRLAASCLSSWHQNAVEDPFVTMASIRQNAYPDLLPDFRNLGVMARVLVAVNALAARRRAVCRAAARRRARALHEHCGVSRAAAAHRAARAARGAVAAGSRACPTGPDTAPWSQSCSCCVALYHGAGGASCRGAAAVARRRARPGGARRRRRCSATSRLLAKAYSPALAEARLQALQARIRPHFLFNSLNAVLSLIRRDPKRAERALEDLADLFRTLMSDAAAVRARSPTRSRCSSATPASSSCAWASGCASPGSSTPRRPTRCCRRSCCSRCSRTRSTTASSPAPARARCWCASSGAATGCSPRIENPYVAEPSSAASATAWRSRTSASAWRCSSTPRRASRRAPTDGRYRVEIEIPYRSEAQA